MLVPDLTAVAAGIVFLITLIALNSLLFRPLIQVVEQREAKTSGCREKARDILQQYESKYEQYERALKEERQAGYKASEAARQKALGERESRIAAARSQVEDFRSKAKSDLADDLEEARKGLRQEADQISRLIADRVLERAS